MFWIVIVAEALLILLIFVKMMSKRRSFADDEDERPSAPELAVLTESLSSDEHWEEGETQGASAQAQPATGTDDPGRKPGITPDMPEEERWE